MTTDPLTSLIDIYLTDWGHALRRGMSADNGYYTACPYLDERTAKGEYVEPEHIGHVQSAVNQLEETQKRVLTEFYKGRKSMLAAAKKLHTNRHTFKVLLKSGQAGVRMYFINHDLIRSVS